MFEDLETTFGRKGWIYQIKKTVKKVSNNTGRTARRRGEEAEQFDLPCPNLATEDIYGGDGEDDVRGRREDDVGEVAAAKRNSSIQGFFF